MRWRGVRWGRVESDSGVERRWTSFPGCPMWLGMRLVISIVHANCRIQRERPGNEAI